jgi:hypothetical protein
MRVKRVLGIAFVLLSISSVGFHNFAAAQQTDQVAAERVLGPRWKQLSRRAGMIFAGTVLGAPMEITNRSSPAIDGTGSGTTPAMQLSFRVDEAIAGVEPGQILIIHEWTGAWLMHRPMRTGEHVLLFLYPQSRLGLTSPVGGALGQVALDASGRSVLRSASDSEADKGLLMDVENASSPQLRANVDAGTVSVIQLERAIRRARSEEE